MSAGDRPEYYGPRDVARLLEIDRRTVSRLIEDGDLEAYRIGPKLIRISRSSLESFLEDRRIV